MPIISAASFTTTTREGGGQQRQKQKQNKVQQQGETTTTSFAAARRRRPHHHHHNQDKPSKNSQPPLSSSSSTTASASACPYYQVSAAAGSSTHDNIDNDNDSHNTTKNVNMSNFSYNDVGAAMTAVTAAGVGCTAQMSGMRLKLLLVFWLCVALFCRSFYPAAVLLMMEDGRGREAMLTGFLSSQAMAFGSTNQNGDDHYGVRKLNDSKPVFVIHVGLHKTGTTFLQSVLCGEEYVVASRILLEDNFTVLGTGTDDACIDHALSSFFATSYGLEMMVTNKYPVQPAADNELELSDVFRRRVNETLHRGLNAMVVFEEFSVYSPAQIQVLAEFLKPHWQVEILIAYRPLYSWLLSVQNQVVAYNRPKDWYQNSGGGGELLAVRLPFDISDGRAYTSQMFRAVLRHGKHPAALVRDKFAAEFGADHVSVLPMQLFPKKWKEQGEPLLGHIFCATLGRQLTPNTCSAVEVGELGTSSDTHTSRDTNVFLLADAAYDRKLIPPHTPRLHAIDTIERYYDRQHKQKNKQLYPKTCMSQESLDHLERISWQVERSLFDEYDVFNKNSMFGRARKINDINNNNHQTLAALRPWLVRDGIADARAALRLAERIHRDGFRRMVDKQKYCRVDVDRWLDQHGAKCFPPQGGQNNNGTVGSGSFVVVAHEEDSSITS